MYWQKKTKQNLFTVFLYRCFKRALENIEHEQACCLAFAWWHPHSGLFTPWPVSFCWFLYFLSFFPCEWWGQPEPTRLGEGEGGRCQSFCIAVKHQVHTRRDLAAEKRIWRCDERNGGWNKRQGGSTNCHKNVLASTWNKWYFTLYDLLVWGPVKNLPWWLV